MRNVAILGIMAFILAGCGDQRPPAERTADALAGAFPTATITVTPSPTMVPSITPTSAVGAAFGDLVGAVGELAVYYDAYSACQSFVSKRLKAPSTASFAPITSEDILVGQEGNVTTIRAWVDAQNSYGAMVRSTFRCEVESTPEGWRLQELTFDREPE